MKPALPRPGDRARQVVRTTGLAAGTGLGLAAAGAGLVLGEAKLARRTIGEPTEHAPDPSGSYGHPKRGVKPLRLAVLGDSSAAGLGVDDAAQTPGALLAGGVARDLGRRVRLDVVAVVGALSADLDTQVAKALQSPVDLAVIMIGANDVTHTVWPGDASARLGRAVATLRAAGAVVVVGTCPDLGTVKPLLQPLKTVAAYWSRRLATAQAVAVAENDGIAVSLGSLLAEEFSRHEGLWSADRFHPSADGYRRVADVLLPSLLEGLGVDIPVSVPVSDGVYDVDVAAGVAAREPGVVVETVEGEEGVASVGPGRLARLVRRLPLVGRGAPDERDEEAADEEAEATG